MSQFFKKTLLIFLGISFGIVTLEITVRFIPDPEPSRLLGLIEPDPHIGTIYKKNLDTYIEAEDNKRNTIPFRTNNAGFIGKNWMPEKQEMRIVNHGDSFTAGLAVPYEKNYVSTLGNELSKRMGIMVESLNLGVTGQGTGEALETYRHYGRRAGGDVVLLWMFLGNDFFDNIENITTSIDETATAEEKPTEKETFFIVKLLKKSELIFFVKDRVAQAPWGHRVFLMLSKIPGMKQFIYRITLAEYPPKIPTDLLLMFTKHEKNEIALEYTKRYIKEFAQIITEDKGKFFVILVPADFQVDHNVELYLYKQYPELPNQSFDVLQPNLILGEALNTLSISYLDLTPTFVNAYKEGRSLYICRFCHFNEEGHILAGTTVAEWLYNNYLNKTE